MILPITTEWLRRCGYDLKKNPPVYWFPSKVVRVEDIPDGTLA